MGGGITGDDTPPSALLPDGKTVLLVEDEKTIRAFAARALRHRGYTALTASSGEVAITVVRDNSGLALLISDTVMPGMDGATLACLVRAEWPGIRVILTSGYSDDINSGELTDLPDAHFLPKPFSLEGLANLVGDVLADVMTVRDTPSTPYPARLP